MSKESWIKKLPVHREWPWMLAEFAVQSSLSFDGGLEPIAHSIPLAEDSDVDISNLQLLDESGNKFPLQAEVLSCWPSGKPQWLSLAFVLEHKATSLRNFRVLQSADLMQLPENSPTRPTSDGSPIVFDRDALFQYASSWMGQPLATVSLSAVDAHNNNTQIDYSTAVHECSGPVYDRYRICGSVFQRKPLSFFALLTHFKSTGGLKLDLTLHNPRRAEHPHGFWDCGDPNSAYLSSLYLDVETHLQDSVELRWVKDSKEAMQRESLNSWKIVQYSSGGDQWRSGTHRKSDGTLPNWHKGYRLRYANQQIQGERAAPILTVADSTGSLTTALTDFWEKFPSAIEVDGSRLRLAMLPELDEAHELQPGEQITRTFWIQCAGPEAKPSNMGWIHRKSLTVNSTRLLHDTKCLEWLPPPSSGSAHPIDDGVFDLEQLLSGPDNFFNKREKIDEYGWRNFGDVWADHEEAYAKEAKPLISHYNNQYDLLYGFLQQFLASGDGRWWDLARPLANHIIDIDIYHTQDDRSAYNGGMFWHTAHYRDAGTATHRTFSKSMLIGEHAVAGGGPSNEHNYSSGLCLYYLLTGDPRARHAVCSLADWVVQMDDGAIGVLAPFNGQRTGNASSTSQSAYHGPGRGVGNSINALVDAWRLTLNAAYLEKCDELIRRCFHPQEDIAQLDLLNAELRWSYTVGLQALIRYVRFAENLAACSSTVKYAQACVLHFARWMVENEGLSLDHVDKLEFPTETWPAQDMRKGTTVMLAALWATEPERQRMWMFGTDLLQRAYRQLSTFPTCYHTRPSAIVLQQLPIARFAIDAYQQAMDQPVSENDAWKVRPAFVSQKQQVKSDLGSPTGLLKMALRSVRPNLWRHTIPHTLLGRWYRNVERRWLS